MARHPQKRRSRAQAKIGKNVGPVLDVERVRLDRGGYTSSGRYFGIGPKLYRVTSPYLDIDLYVRAKDAQAARDSDESLRALLSALHSDHPVR